MSWRKKKKDIDKAKLLETMGKIRKNQEEELRCHLDKRTPAQEAFEKVQEKQQMERILKKASESIRETQVPSLTREDARAQEQLRPCDTTTEPGSRHY
ncbi:TPA: hypothetical protein BOS_18227 [Bos taurus]|nr:TPA: hypothetical protein BOS_18227 [Bos taurus]